MTRFRTRRSLTALGNAIVLLVLLVLLWLIQQSGGLGLGTAPTDAPMATATTAAAPAWFELFVTTPGSEGTNPVETALIAGIASARQSVDVAVYDLDLPAVAEALVQAQARGVPVRVVTDSDHLDQDAIRQLEAAGIPVHGDGRGALMHNKFVVVDRATVWTGSVNFTFSDVYRNNNHLMRIASSDLAHDYAVEFEEMFARSEFGPTSQADTPFPVVTLDGTSVESYFAPEDKVASHLIGWIESAQRSLHVMAFAFTSDPIGDALLARAAAGVSVHGVFERSQVASNPVATEYARLQAAGLDVRLDGNPYNMHHKVIVLDAGAVAFGSYNFSRSAEHENDENLLIVHHAGLAAQFLQEFERVYQQAPAEGSG